jgi:hypothetical protein
MITCEGLSQAGGRSLRLQTIYYLHLAVANPMPEFEGGEGFLATVKDKGAAPVVVAKEASSGCESGD